jgi:hypothetical protein
MAESEQCRNATSKAASCPAGATLCIAVCLVVCSSASVMAAVSLAAVVDRAASGVLVCTVTR